LVEEVIHEALAFLIGELHPVQTDFGNARLKGVRGAIQNRPTGNQSPHCFAAALGRKLIQRTQDLLLAHVDLGHERVVVILFGPVPDLHQDMRSVKFGRAVAKSTSKRKPALCMKACGRAGPRSTHGDRGLAAGGHCILTTQNSRRTRARRAASRTRCESSRTSRTLCSSMNGKSTPTSAFQTRRDTSAVFPVRASSDNHGARFLIAQLRGRVEWKDGE
jgi:hypothetical protein